MTKNIWAFAVAAIMTLSACGAPDTGEQALEMLWAEGYICGNFFQGGLRCIICLDVFNGCRYPVEIGMYL
jgi:hypothetical protein